jgi:hypothetical protein
VIFPTASLSDKGRLLLPAPAHKAVCLFPALITLKYTYGFDSHVWERGFSSLTSSIIIISLLFLMIHSRAYSIVVLHLGVRWAACGLC